MRPVTPSISSLQPIAIGFLELSRWWIQRHVLLEVLVWYWGRFSNHVLMRHMKFGVENGLATKSPGPAATGCELVSNQARA